MKNNISEKDKKTAFYLAEMLQLELTKTLHEIDTIEASPDCIPVALSVFVSKEISAYIIASKRDRDQFKKTFLKLIDEGIDIFFKEVDQLPDRYESV